MGLTVVSNRCVVRPELYTNHRDEAFELPKVPDDGAVEELAAQGADPAVGVGVRHRGPNRCLENLEAFGSENLVEGVGELAAAVAYECSRIRESAVVA